MKSQPKNHIPPTRPRMTIVGLSQNLLRKNRVWLNYRLKSPLWSDGQGLVEFAIALPILLFLVLGIIESGRLLFIYNAVSNASREAARYGAGVGDDGAGTQLRYRDCTGIVATAKRVGSLAGINGSDISIAYDNNGSGFTPGCPPSEPPYVALGDRIRVSVSVPYQPIVPLIPFPAFDITSENVHTIIKNVWAVGQVPAGVVLASPTDEPAPSSTPTPTATLDPNSPPIPVTGDDPTLTPTPTLPPTTTPTPMPSCENYGITAKIVQGNKNFGIYGYTVDIWNAGNTNAYLNSAQIVWNNQNKTKASDIVGIYFGGTEIDGPYSLNPAPTSYFVDWPNDPTNVYTQILAQTGPKTFGVKFSDLYSMSGLNLTFNVSSQGMCFLIPN